MAFKFSVIFVVVVVGGVVGIRFTVVSLFRWKTRTSLSAQFSIASVLCHYEFIALTLRGLYELAALNVTDFEGGHEDFRCC